MSRRAVACYDLSGRAGYAVYHPDLDEPVYGTLTLPPTTTTGSCGPAGHLLFDHIAWVDRQWPLAKIGYEAFLAPTGSKKKDEDKGFTTSQATLKKLIGTIVVLETCASILGIPDRSINNSSWRRYWLGSQKRGTDRDEWKKLSVAKAKGLGWSVKNDDEADALGQLHFMLAEMNIKTRYGRNPSRELIDLGMRRGVPIHV